MKKFLCGLLCVLCLGTYGCTIVEAEETSDTSMFIEVESTSLWRVVYHKETKVMYVVSTGSYNGGTFTVLVDKYGNPLLWRDKYVYLEN